MHLEETVARLVFVDTARFSGGLGFEYRLLGLISGEVFENEDLSLV